MLFRNSNNPLVNLQNIFLTKHYALLIQYVHAAAAKKIKFRLHEKKKKKVYLKLLSLYIV